MGREQRLVLDKAYRYLLDQGFGVLELASLDLDEVPAMAPGPDPPAGRVPRV